MQGNTDSDDDASAREEEREEEEQMVERISFAEEGLLEFPFKTLSRAGVECSAIGAELVVDLQGNALT